MKHFQFFLIALFAISFFSCSDVEKRAKREAEQARLDSLKTDSIEKAQILNDSLSMIAWGDVKFGMSKKEVMQTTLFKGGYDDVKDEVSPSYEKKEKMKETLGFRRLMSFDGFLEEDELKTIIIKSYPVSANIIDDLIYDCELFTKNFKKLYGKPVLENEITGYSDINRGNNYYSSFAVEGKNGTKKILITLKASDDYEYSYEVQIWNDGFPKKKHTPTAEEIKKEKEERAEEAEIKADSF